MIERTDIISAIYDLFVIRNDVFSVQQMSGKYFPEDMCISGDILDQHLNGVRTIGIYTISKEKKCKWICYDFDGENLPKEKGKAVIVYNHLKEMGYDAIIEFSGKKGYHVWIFFNETDAYSAYQFGRQVCNGYEVHEIFPKQYEIKEDGLGNLVKLPFGIHQVSKNRSYLLHPITYEEVAFQDGLEMMYALSKREKKEIPKYVKVETEVVSVPVSEMKDEMSDVTRYLINNGVGEGHRHKKEWFITVDLYFAGWSEQEILEQVLIFNKNCRPPKDEHLVINHVNSILKNPKDYIEKFGFIKEESIESALKWIMKRENERTERNKMADKEVIAFDQRLFNYSVAMAFVKNMRIITTEDTGEIMYYNKENGIYEENGEEKIESVCIQYLNKYKTTSAMKEVLANIKAKTFVKRKSINQSKMVFAIKNGIFNIETMELNKFSPDIILTTSIPVKYDATTECPKFKKFLTEIIDERDMLNIQEFFGYCLYRDYHIHKAFMLYGSGSNGKSTLINVLKNLLGEDNVISIPLQDFDSDKFSSAYLFNKLANMYADLPDKALHNTGRFKMLTGNDMISAQKKFLASFNFTNYAH
jgi:DNA primase catalytic subunit